jgi:hypothetical protein
MFLIVTREEGEKKGEKVKHEGKTPKIAFFDMFFYKISTSTF